jgi:signal-transduction protein with cAMP-binding, CBS, and nucleotidyltransferase domain
LLAEARRWLDTNLSHSDAFLARFASAVDQFVEPSGWWSWLTGSRRDEQPLDLKKLGTFPIVHGVRALALQYHVRATGTVQRMQRLVEQRHIDAALAHDLIDALHFLMALKLRHQLRQREQGEPASNLVRAVRARYAGARTVQGLAGHHQALPRFSAPPLPARFLVGGDACFKASLRNVCWRCSSPARCC